MSLTHAAPAPKDAGPLTVSHPHDPAERQADQAADVVARGGSVTGWSFASVQAGGPSIHRDEAGPKQPTEAEKYKAGAKKAGEALLETKPGKELIEKIEDTAPVKAIKKGLDTTAGKVIAGGVIAAGAGGLAAAKQPLPVQLPEITVAPGVSVGVHVEGPLNSPTGGGITLTFKERGGSGKNGPTESDRIADETRRLRASTEMFKSTQQKAQEQADERAVVAAMFARSAGLKPVIPLLPGAKPYVIETPTDDKPAADEPTKDAAPPVQREAASASPARLDTSGVETVSRGGGRPLDTGVRRSMEARFGYDFSSVRVHDDAQGHAAAEGVQATAFTVGEHIGFAPGRSAASSSNGTKLLAHELAHVVQHRHGKQGQLRRQKAAPPASFLEELPEAERKRIKIRGEQYWTGPMKDLFDKGYTMDKKLPKTTSIDLRGVPQDMASGLTNLATGLVTSGILPANTTTTMKVPVKTGGSFRFTHSRQLKAKTAEVVVEDAFPKAAVPAATKKSAGATKPASPGAAAPAIDPYLAKVKAGSLTIEGFDGTELAELKVALQKVPDAHLARVSGLTIRRATDVASDKQATKADKARRNLTGEYRSKHHSVTIYDHAFADTANVFGDTGPGISGPARTILHEIGHAVDGAPKRDAHKKLEEAVAAEKHEKAHVAEATKGLKAAGKPSTKAKPNQAYDEAKAAKATAQAEHADAVKARAAAAKVDQATKSRSAVPKDYQAAAMKDAAGLKGSAISSYGATGWAESFAEAYSYYLASPKLLQQLRPNTYDWFVMNLAK